MVSVHSLAGNFDGFISRRGVETFLGIPYAQSPVGNLRWQPPTSCPHRNESYDCRHFGPSAMQLRDRREPASLVTMSEDCLTLNIWVHDHTKAQQPVIVFIHGGAFLAGGTNDALYSGDAFASDYDVVFVTINFRLGTFGSCNFSDMPDGNDVPQAPYVSVLDQIKALSWVHENIESFGGNPENVTLMGQSSGAASAGQLAVCSKAHGLFSRVIMQSGPVQLYKTRKQSLVYSDAFIRIMHARSVSDLMHRPAEEILYGMRKLCHMYRSEASLLFSPVCDGTLLPEKPLAAWQAGVAKDIDVLLGYTKDELSYFTLYYHQDQLPKFWHGQTKFHFDGHDNISHWEDIYQHHYHLDDRAFAQRYIDFMNQIGVKVAFELLADMQSAYRPTYLYRFDYASKIDGLGATHAIDLPFVFENLDTSHGLEVTGANPPCDLAQRVSYAWYEFARTGMPRVKPYTKTVHIRSSDSRQYCISAWQPYSADRSCMIIQADQWSVAHHINDENRAMFMPLYRGALLRSSSPQQ